MKTVPWENPSSRCRKVTSEALGASPVPSGSSALRCGELSHLEDHPTYSTEAILEGFPGVLYHLYNYLEDHPIIARNGEHLPMVSQKVPLRIGRWSSLVEVTTPLINHLS